MDAEHRAALAVHHTDTTDESWDGPAAEANCPAEESPLREAHAWLDAEADPDTKAAYKFIHHEVNSDGNVGAANLNACSSAIAVLNGGRGGSAIPDSDRPGVWRHLAAHLRDGNGEDYEPPALRARFRQARELRFTTDDGLEVRDAAEGGPTITGHAAVFNKWSEDLGGYREKISPGAFAKTIADGADVRALFNHDPNFVLGRTKAGTLTLSEDKRGLRFEAHPPDTQTVRDLVLTPIRRGDVSQCSFSFRAIQEEWDAPDYTERTLSECALFDVSPVTFPAYPQTDTQVRTILAFVGLDFDTLTTAMAKADRGFEPTKAELEQINDAISTLRSLIPVKPVPKDHSAEAPKAGRSVAHLRRLLELEREEMFN